MWGNFTDESGSQPHFEAHRSYITGVTQNTCGYVLNLPRKLQCHFVTETPDCHDMERFFDYIDMAFCHTFLATFSIELMLAWVLFLLLVLLVNAKTFFVPSMMIIANRLKMGQYLAGVTVLAIGNGMADLISSTFTYGGDTTEIVVNQMFGTALFVSLFIGGIITTCWPSSVSYATCMWTNVFYVVSLLYLLFILRNEEVDVAEAIGCIILYIIYLTFLVIKHYRSYFSQRSQLQHEKSADNPELHSALKRKFSLEYTLQHPIQMRSVLFEIMPPDQNRANSNLFAQFWEHLKPKQNSEFSEMNCWRRFFFVLEVPIEFLLTLCVPTVSNSYVLRGWCKMGVMVNVFFLPPIWLVILDDFNLTHCYAGLGLSAFLCLLVFFTSRTDRPPLYHSTITCITYLTSIGIIFVAACECVSTLCTLFMMAHLSRQTMALTVLAWSNSFGDLIANLYVARQGLAPCAKAACDSGPVLNLMLSIAIRCIFRTIETKSRTSKFRSGTMSLVSVTFLASVLIVTTVASLWSRLQLRRSMGIFMIISYVMYLLWALLVEFEIIHSYGTDHYDEKPFDI